VRVGAIDIGTNSVLLTIAELDGVMLRPLLERATITRLGRGVDQHRRLKKDAVERTLACLREYAAALEAARTDELSVVGTSALRDAGDSDSFLDRAEAILGRRPRVIEGDEEARLTFIGALSGLTVSDPVCVFDIGGGSTEIVSGTRMPLGIHTQSSLDVGSVRLYERYVRSDPPAASELGRVNDEVRRALSSVAPPPKDAVCVGVAGTVTTMAAVWQKLDSYDPALVHGTTLSRNAVDAVQKTLARLPLEARRRVPGLDPARADVIVTGIAVTQGLMDWARAPELTVSDRGVRWGLLDEIVERREKGLEPPERS
jgi:exopolyphosphatase/guanosine-5'-triphosphate,3'-diphosphate pyrophosphatase